MGQIDFTKVIPCSLIAGEDPSETKELNDSLLDARRFISSFAWRHGIQESYFGFGVGGVISVFLFKIETAEKSRVEWIWVIVGDIPPAYVVTDTAPTPASALRAYVYEMTRWVNAVKSNEPISDLIPVNVPPTLKFAQLLQKRLDLLESSIIPNVP